MDSGSIAVVNVGTSLVFTVGLAVASVRIGVFEKPKAVGDSSLIFSLFEAVESIYVDVELKKMGLIYLTSQKSATLF